MPDITMCVGTGCPFKEKCYRYTATPNEYRQSIADFTTKLQADKSICQEWIPNGRVSDAETERKS